MIILYVLYFRLQDCIVSLRGEGKIVNSEDVQSLQVSRRGEGGRIVAVAPVEREPVKINLKDCLACSGCVTSAETVLLEQQSLSDFRRILQVYIYLR